MYRRCGGFCVCSGACEGLHYGAWEVASGEGKGTLWSCEMRFWFESPSSASAAVVIAYLRSNSSALGNLCGIRKCSRHHSSFNEFCSGVPGGMAGPWGLVEVKRGPQAQRAGGQGQWEPPIPPPPLCDIPLGCGFFTGPWTVTRSPLRMLRRVAAFCRPLWPVLLLVSFPRSRLARRLEEVAVAGCYRRLQMLLRLALGVRGTLAGHRLGALKWGGGGYPPPQHLPETKVTIVRKNKRHVPLGKSGGVHTFLPPPPPPSSLMHAWLRPWGEMGNCGKLPKIHCGKCRKCV